MKKQTYQQIITASIASKAAQADAILSQNKEKAIAIYTRAVFLNQQIVSNYISLARIYQLYLEYSTAINFYKKAFKLENNALYQDKIKQLLLIKGYMLLQTCNYNNILADTEFTVFASLYQKTIDQLLHSQKAYKFVNALAYLQTDHRNYAIEECNKSLQLYPFTIQLHLLKGKIYWSINKITEGNIQMWSAYDIDKENEQVKLFLSIIIPKTEQLLKETRYLLIQNDINKCLTNIKKGLNLYPNNVDFLIIRAFLNRNKAEFQKSLHDLEVALKHLKDKTRETQLKNQVALTYNQMGMYVFNRQKYQEATTLFNQALKYKPNDWGIIANRGDSYKALGKIQLALLDYKKAKQLQPNKQQIKIRLGAIYNSKGIKNYNRRMLKQAIFQFTLALEECDKVSQFYMNRGKAYLESDLIKQASKDIRMAHELDPKNYQALLLYRKLCPQEK